MKVLPEPKTLDQIALMYSLNKFFESNKTDLIKGLQIEPLVAGLKKGSISSTSANYQKLNLHFLYRAMHQVNEACNKLWSTVELYYHVKADKSLCRYFSLNFLQSASIPTLHYANMTALLSIITLFGVGSWVEKGQKSRYFNIIRTKDRMELHDRKHWLTATFGNAKSGWHGQLLQTYEGLLQNAVSLPQVDLRASRRLLADRNRLHYDILGQASMNGTYGVENYFEHLSTVSTSVKIAIESIHRVVNPIPNRCDVRFKELENKIASLRGLFDLPTPVS